MDDMMDTIELRGITWNHPRGYQSIEAVSSYFTEKHHESIRFHWDRQSLKAFGDHPITDLAGRYDLILMDHPHIGSAVSANALTALDTLLDADFLQMQKRNSVGKSFESYCVDSRPFALPVDAAAQVSVLRQDLMKDLIPDHENPYPITLDDVLILAKKAREHGVYVGIPLCPTDIYCTVITLCAGQGGEVFTQNTINRKAFLEAVAWIEKIAPLLYPDSLDMNPIQMLDEMSHESSICYAPFMFGYSNYSRKECRHVLTFTDIPSASGRPYGALLGGVGIAISSKCVHKDIAAEFVRTAVDPGIQKGIYFENAGQPAGLNAWLDPEVNARSNNFFINTLTTLQHSYLRPRFPGYNRFQEEAGEVLNRSVRRGMDSAEVVSEIEDLYRKNCSKEE